MVLPWGYFDVIIMGCFMVLPWIVFMSLCLHDLLVKGAET